MSTTLLNCIERIPDALRNLIDQSDLICEELRRISMPQKIKKMVCIGSGSSYNAAAASRQFLECICHIPVECEYPNVFLQKTEVDSSDTILYLFISQGGSTRMVYECAERVKNAGGKTCALVAEPESSPIAKLCDCAIPMGCGQEEFMYRTLGYSCTVAALWIIGLCHTNQISLWQKEFQAMLDQLPEVRLRTQAWYEQNKFSLLRRNKAMLTGSGVLWQTAQEADIKLMEMVPMMTRSYELEEFIHGPQNCFADDMLFFVLIKDGQDVEKATAIAKFLKNEIGFCAMVGDITLDQRDLLLPSTNPWLCPLVYITSFQVLAYCMATARGRDLSRGVNAQIKNYISKTL